MAITIPTVDEFTESTVMLVIREIAEYICGDNGLVAQINNNDITGFTSSYKDNVLKIDATKGDGSTIPVCNVTIEGGGSSTGNPYPTAVSGTVGVDGNIKFTITMSSGSPLTTTINMNHFASAEDLSDLQEQVSGIKPTVTTNLETSPPTITVAVNGTSSTANLPSGGSSTYAITTDRLRIIKNDLSTIDSILRANVGKLASIEATAFTKTTETSDTYYIFGVITENYQDYINGTIGIVGNGLHVNLYATQLNAQTFPYVTAVISANIRTDNSTLAFRYITNSGIEVKSPNVNFKYRLIIFG